MSVQLRQAMKGKSGQCLLLFLAAGLLATSVQAEKIHCFVTERETLTHTHDHGRGIDAVLAYGFYAGRSNQTWNSETRTQDPVDAKFERCYTFHIRGLADCNEWHSDNVYVCTNHGDMIAESLGNFTGTLHMGFEEAPENDVAALRAAEEWINRRALRFGKGHSIDDMTVAQLRAEDITQSCATDFCNDADSDSMDQEVQLMLHGPSCYVTNVIHPLTSSHSHGRDVDEGHLQFFNPQKRPFLACVTVHVDHLDDCLRWGSGSEHGKCLESDHGDHDHGHDHGHDHDNDHGHSHGRLLRAEHEHESSSEHSHDSSSDHEHGHDSSSDHEHGRRMRGMVDGYIHMGFRHTPTERDMERMESWFNHEVLHAQGIMHQTAHFSWSKFQEKVCTSDDTTACNHEHTGENDEFILNVDGMKNQALENERKNRRIVHIRFTLDSEELKESLRNRESQQYQEFKKDAEEKFSKALNLNGAKVVLERLLFDTASSRRSLLSTEVTGEFTFTAPVGDVTARINDVIRRVNNGELTMTGVTGFQATLIETGTDSSGAGSARLTLAGISFMIFGLICMFI